MSDLGGSLENTFSHDKAHLTPCKCGNFGLKAGNGLSDVCHVADMCLKWPLNQRRSQWRNIENNGHVPVMVLIPNLS